MKKKRTPLLIIGILVACFILGLLHTHHANAATSSAGKDSTARQEELRAEVLQVLQNKCNACHRKQNPFMVFTDRNMGKKASRIYKAVFEERRMPKNGGVEMTPEEYAILEKWLHTQNLN